MTLVEHAEHELRAAGLFDEDSDYDGWLGESVLELVRTFAAQGHSGFSAYSTIDLFERVATYRALTPITSNPDEWAHIDEDVWGEPGGIWQSRRQPDLFSRDGGQTWHSVDDPRWHQRIRGWWFRRRSRR